MNEKKTIFWYTGKQFDFINPNGKLAFNYYDIAVITETSLIDNKLVFSLNLTNK